MMTLMDEVEEGEDRDRDGDRRKGIETGIGGRRWDGMEGEGIRMNT